MRWCFESAAHPYADSVLRRIAGGEPAVVPVLWLYEASAVLARAQTRGTRAAAKAGEFITELQALDITVDEESAAQVLTGVHPLAFAHRLTSYDAAYLELAVRRSLPLATLDEDLLRASKAAGVAALSQGP